MTWWTSLTSSGLRTNDSATKSTPRRSANSRSSASLSDIAGTLTVDAGQRQALVVADHAALGDVADDVGAVLDVDRDQRDVAVVDEQPVAGPHVVGELLVGRRDAVVGALDVLDGDPDALAGGPLDRARRRSGRAGSSGPAGRRGRRRCGPAASAAWRTSWKRRPWSACSPWLKFSRATSMPASTSARARSGVSVAGPSVQTIFARRITLKRKGFQPATVTRPSVTRGLPPSTTASTASARGRPP